MAIRRFDVRLRSGEMGATTQRKSEGKKKIQKDLAEKKGRPPRNTTETIQTQISVTRVTEPLVWVGK